MTPPICCMKLVPAPNRMRRKVCCEPLWKTSRQVISPSALSRAIVVTMMWSRSCTSGSSIGFATSRESTTFASCWRSFKHNHRGDSAKIGKRQAVPIASALWNPSGNLQDTGLFGMYVKPKFIQLVRTKPKTRNVSWMATSLPRNEGLQVSLCHIGIVVVLTPMPSPPITRPMIMCGKVYAVAWRMPPTVRKAQPRVTERLLPKISPMTCRAMGSSQYSVPDITWARGLASKSVLLVLLLRAKYGAWA